MSSICDASVETRTIRSKDLSNSNDTYSINSIYQRVHNTSTLSNTSIIDTLDNIPVCFKKSENDITNDSFTEDYNLHVSCAPEGVFHIFNELIATFTTLDLTDSVKIKEDNGQNIYKRAEIILPNYSDCCMWGYENVRDCGDTSRCK
jgi:hypothetical protein